MYVLTTSPLSHCSPQMYHAITSALNAKADGEAFLAILRAEVLSLLTATQATNKSRYLQLLNKFSLRSCLEELVRNEKADSGYTDIISSAV